MSKDYFITYIGYLTSYHYNDPVLLCVSNDKNKVKYYLRNVRGLDKSDYEIREVMLDYEIAISLYEDYILEYFEEDCLYLTNQDIECINKEIDNIVYQLEKSYEEFKKYSSMIKGIYSLENDYNQISLSLNIMKSHLSKVKVIRKIANNELKKSFIFSKNILEYLKNMKYIQEDKELTNLFYRKVYDND